MSNVSLKERPKVYNPDKITLVEIEELIDIGYRFDVVHGLPEEEYDEVLLCQNQ